MMHARRLIALLGLLLAAILVLPAQAQTSGQNHIAAELVAEGPVQPGEVVELAFHFRPEQRWHGYWSNPGDAGYGMSLDWHLPEGWSTGEPDYPVPDTLLIQGLMNHVYEGDYAVLVPLAVPAGVAAGIYPVEVEAQWLACTDEICVPERAVLGTTVVVGVAGSRDARFDGWRAAIPPLIDQSAVHALEGGRLRIGIPLPASLAIADPHVFLAEDRLVEYAGAQLFRRDGDMLVAELPLRGTPADPGQLSGILKLDDAGNGVRFAGTAGAVPRGGDPVGEVPAGQAAPLWVLLGGALLGGLLLNIMPCVFPILSLKALTLARAGESEVEARREGFAYTAGVVLAVLALGGLLLALRAAGNEIGWAFQLQEPGVVVALLLLAAAITANLAGLFELPGLAITRAGGRGSAFATGLLAAFVATPCTGPFMAAAMGAALLLPVPQALLLFAALGLGLALPFLLLGWVPPLRRLLPRPGGWMNTFKKIMAVPMGLTALALLWLALQLGGSGFAALAGLLAAALVGLLAYVGLRQHGGRSGVPAFLAGGAALVLASVLALPAVYETQKSSSGESLLAAQPFSAAALAEARAEGRPVFLWFTADWCLTCKVNESVAIEREATRDAFEKAGVVPMVGDWTRRDPAITRFLTAQGAAGVPLYLWYAPGAEGEQLPQVLTPDSLVSLAGRLPRAGARGTR